MRKHLFLTSLLAIVVTGAANAETDVTFGGNYALSTDTEGAQSGSVASAPVDTTYEYDVTDGSTISDVNYAEDPDVTKFTFTDPTGTTQNVSFENRYEQSDYVGTTAVTGDSYQTSQEIVAGAHVSESNYSYAYDLAGEEIRRTLDNPSTFVGDMTALSEDYAGSTSINVVNGEAFVNGSATALTDANDLDYTLYGFTFGDSYYNLDKEGDDFILVRNGEVVQQAIGELAAEFDNAKNAYAADVAALDANITGTAADWATEKTYYDTAKGFFDADVATVATLDNNYASQAIADNLYSAAQAAQGIAQADQNANTANYNAAVALYNTPIETVQAATLQDAKDYTDAETARAQSEEAALQNKIDNEVARATAQEAAIRGEIAAGDARTLANANAYTDKKVDTLEKNVSGGVAAATALSAVEVSNVKKGEVSVGGGYGYYNNQSAMAFGAAMGLSDRWSVNAGAGIANGDKTQVSFRAGTNYKFKLF